MRFSFPKAAAAPAPGSVPSATKQIELKGASVFIAMPTHRPLEPETIVALVGTIYELDMRGIRWTLEFKARGSLIHHSRSKAAEDFRLSTHTHLFWIDSDMVWKPADFLRMLALATVMPCVTAAYTAKCDPPLMLMSVDAGVMHANEYGCLPIKGHGLGFTCVQREVIETLAQHAPRCRFPDVPQPIPHIFRLDDVPDRDGVLDARGEDIAFFADVRARGFKVWLDPNITLGHIGPKTYSASVLDFMEPQQPA